MGDMRLSVWLKPPYDYGIAMQFSLANISVVFGTNKDFENFLLQERCMLSVEFSVLAKVLNLGTNNYVSKG